MNAEAGGSQGEERRGCLSWSPGDTEDKRDVSGHQLVIELQP